MCLVLCDCRRAHTRLGTVALRFIALFALACHLASNPEATATDEYMKGNKPSRQLLQADDSTLPDPFSEIIPDQYIVALQPEYGDTTTAVALLATEVQAALQEAAVRTGAAEADALLAGALRVDTGAFSHSNIHLLKVLGSEAANKIGEQQLPAADTTTEDVQASAQLAVLSVSAAALPLVRQSQLVTAVIPDLVVRAVPMQCLGLTDIAQGVSATPTAQFKWSGCYTSRARLVWRGTTCGNGNSVYWHQIRALDRTTNAIIADPSRRQCILYPSLNRTSNLELFGACGVAPRFAPTLPTRICSPGGGTGTSPGTLPRVPIQSGESVPVGLLRVEAATTAGVANISAGLPLTVGIMDSGIDATHPDLNYVGGSSWVAASPALPQDANPAVDAYGHGTHVSGTVGARNNGQGVVGVAPGVPLYSLKMLSSAGAGSLSDAIAAINWVASPTGGRAKGIRVVNLSFAGYVDPNQADYQDSLSVLCAPFRAANDAGIATVAAAGNYGSSVAGWLPAACPSVLAVTAVDGPSNTAASWSNFLPTTASAAEQDAIIAAPGTGINSTMSYSKNASGYRELSGTSVACPHGEQLNDLLTSKRDAYSVATLSQTPQPIAMSDKCHMTGIIATCLMSGACPSNSTGSAIYATIQAAAKERLAQVGKPAFGFIGDATGSINGKYYGYMAWAKH